MSALDEVYERMRGTGPEFDGWLSNHGPMAADALLRMGADGHAVRGWLDGYARRLEEQPAVRWPVDPLQWREPLGDARRLGDWRALFDRELAEQPWTDVLARWWPRLLPGAVAAATHPLIRTGHVVRALREEVTTPRLGELAEALGYWAARWQPVPGAAPPRGRRSAAAALDALPVLAADGGIRTRLAALAGHPTFAERLTDLAPVAADDVPAALTTLVDAAVARYARWAPGNPVMLVHAATAPRAALLVLPSLPRALWVATHAAAWTTSATIATVYRPAVELPDPEDDVPTDEVVAAALASGDEHAVKFAETALESADRGVPTARAAAVRAAALIG